MFAGIASFLGGLFSQSKTQDTIIDGLRKLGGLDEMTPLERHQSFFEVLKETKHQSPVRRFIALALTIAYTLVIFIWLFAAGFGYLLAYVPAIEYAGAVRMFMEAVIVQPFNIILAFYFVTNLVTNFKK